MKIRLFLAVYLTFYVLSCKKSDHTPAPPEPPTEVDIIKLEDDRFSKVIAGTTIDGYISGIVVAEDEQPLTGVSVSCGTNTVVTNSKGFFQFPTKLSLNKDYAVITAMLNGYFKNIKTFTPNPSGKANHYFKIKLLKTDVEKTIAATGGNIVLDNKIDLTFPNDAVVTETGARYTGQYKILARYIDPDAGNFLDIMPGELAGLNDQNQINALQSYGMADVEIKDMSGNTLNIAPGKTVKMLLPAPDNAPASLSLWHFNEKNGLWIKTGTATKSGNNYSAEVNHFSTWSVGADVDGFTVSLQFKSLQGSPLAGLRVQAFAQSKGHVLGFYTDNEGKATLIKCPVTEPLILKTIFECDTIINTLAPVTANRDEVITLENNLSFIRNYTIKGTLTGCDNAPLINQPFQIAVQSSGRSIPGVTDGQGAYLITSTFCNPNNTPAMQAQSFIGNEYLFAPAITIIDTSITYNARICDSTSGVSNDFIVVFPDPILEEVIREKINKPAGAILYSDVKDIDTLNGAKEILDFVVKNFEGIQFCTNVKYVRFFVQDIDSLSAFQNLANLRFLRLTPGHMSTKFITDISPLKNLILLETLHLEETKITDLSPLQDLTQLKDIMLNNGLISDVSPLKNLTNLESLSLYGNQITDITSLKSLPQLKSLNVGYNKISDITPLKDIVSLQTLVLNQNQISDFSPVQNMSNLKGLSLTGCGISNLGFLQNLTNLESLTLMSNQFTDITPLQNLLKLKNLALSVNNITSIAALQNMTQMEVLYLEGNSISDLSPIQNLNKIFSLYLTGNKISDITALKNLTSLAYLFAENNTISDLTPLQNLPLLQLIMMGYNNIADINPLINGVPSLTSLSIQNQQPGKLSQSQKDAFKTTHPNAYVTWD